jgi:hypothetical protein
MTLPEFEALEEFYNKNVISRKEYLDLLIGGGVKKKKAVELVDFADGLYLDDCVPILQGKDGEFLGYNLKYKKDDLPKESK